MSEIHDAVRERYASKALQMAQTGVTGRLGLAWLTPFAAVLIVITCLGSAGAWLGSVARIPFVAGLDHFLPSSFGRLHPRYGSPANALIVQTAIAMAFAVMGQAGTTVKGAYEIIIVAVME